jgi:type 1 glutamine amidotransferase
MKIAPRALIILAVLSAFSTAQSGHPPKKHLLVIGEEKGYRHDSVFHAMATIERLGRETGLWDTTLRTDTEVLTKKKLEYNAQNLNDFDAVLFFTGGDLEMNAQQKTDFLSFIHEEGKGFIGVHSAAITFVDWPEFVEMVGGTYDEHPWTTFDAPILVEDPGFPGMQQFPHSFTLRDEIYQMKDYSRDKVRVLMRLDVSKLDMKNKNVHRTDGDFAVTWAKRLRFSDGRNTRLRFRDGRQGIPKSAVARQYPSASFAGQPGLPPIVAPQTKRFLHVRRMK